MTIQTLPTQDEPILFDSVNWQQFKTVQPILERPGVRISFLEGVLEIRRMPGRKHEVIKHRISTLMDIYLEMIGLDYTPTGSVTLESEIGLVKREADLSYELGEGKSRPDLVIEVVITSGGIDKLEAYRRLEISEVWFWEDNKFSAYHLRTEGKKKFYEKINQSECLPHLDFAILTECVEIPNQIQAIRKFRQFIGGNNQT